MPDVLAETLSEKDVMGTDGGEIGSLYNITMDLESGRLRDLVVSPHEEADGADFETDDSGRFLVPARRVQSVRDYIVVER